MRKTMGRPSSDYRIAILDDETGIVDSVSLLLKRAGYSFKGFTDPLEALQELQSNHYDMLILDYLMDVMHGDEVVEKIREFNRDLYILLLTGHKDIAPPLETLRTLEIQGYCEKSDKFDQLTLLVESGIKSISQMRRIKKFEDGLNKILRAVPKIYQLKPIGNILEEILMGIMPLVNSHNAFILDDANKSNNFNGNNSIFKGIGKYNVSLDEFMKMINPQLIEKIGYARETGKAANLKDGVIFPLTNEFQNSMGVIYVETNEMGEGVQLLDIYSRQAASSLSNAFLHSLVNTKNEELSKAYEELKTRYMDTIEVLRLAVDAKDEYTRGHSDRVAYYAVRIGNAFELSEDEQEMLRLGGIFHDVGKIGTADDILFKTESLDDREYNEVKKHTIKGANILSAVSMFKEVVPLIKCHHERLDGRGYPDGIKGEDIPFLARILSVADAFDAMTSDRLYRSKLNLEEAKKQLIDASGTQFDNDIVNKFIEILDSEYANMQEEILHTFK
jgi:putative nucleotidyltransferase with HDIG domain